jgi:PAS domain S-box-containing protein
MSQTQSMAAGGGSTGEIAALLDRILDPLFIIDAESGLISHCNTAALRWQGCEYNAAVGKPFRVLLPETETGTRQDLLAHTNVHGHVFMEQTFVGHGGRTVRVDLSASMWRRREGDAVVLILRDAESRLATQRSELAARQTAARLETLARLSHEINNPLQALLMHTGSEFDQTARDHVDQIAAAMRRMREEEEQALPHPPPAATHPAAPPLAALVRADPRRLLIADDSVAIRRSLSLLLQRAMPDLQVDLAADGEEAVGSFKQNHPAVIVLDVQMPRKSGDKVFEEVLAFCREQHWEEPRVAFCTGYTPPPGIVAALTPPTRHICLLKPVQPSDLRTAIRELVTAALAEHS